MGRILLGSSYLPLLYRGGKSSFCSRDGALCSDGELFVHVSHLSSWFGSVFRCDGALGSMSIPVCATGVYSAPYWVLDEEFSSIRVMFPIRMEGKDVPHLPRKGNFLV